MVIYSVYPPEVVFKEEEKSPQFFSLEFGRKALVLEYKDGQAKVVRLLSADPKDYLNPDFQPGAVMNFNFQKL